MDYEKAYKAMVQRAKELHKDGNTLTKQQMEIVCPELQESEDERIRKELIGYAELKLKYFAEANSKNDIDKKNQKWWKDVVSYLEKQKEPKPDKCNGCNNVKGCINCVDGDQWEHIYDEQKPVSREEILGQLLQSGLITMPDYLYLIDKQKPEGGDSGKPNNQWSEEDTYMVNVLECIVARYRPDEIFKIGNKQSISAYKICSWLGFLRFRSRWKPSEEQMDALRSKLPIIMGTGNYVDSLLESLFQDLKKL